MKIGLVLSGGGARGFAQIGILKVLKENNIHIDAIAGCSVGALIGACYAYNRDPKALEELLLKIHQSKYDVYDYSFSLKGFIKGQKLQGYIENYFGKGKETTFADLQIPLYVNAADLKDGDEIILNKGPLIPAIMASLSYPGFFTTRKIDGRICVDGGVVNPLPVNLLKSMDYLIIVDVSEEKKEINEDSNIKDVILQSTLIMQKTIVNLRMKECKEKYTLIKPDIKSTPTLSFKNAPQLISVGEIEANKVIEKIKKDISR